MTYSEFLNLIASKKIIWGRVQFELIEEDIDKYYELKVVDGRNIYFCNINNIDEPSNVEDFETNYKDQCNKALCVTDSYGVPINVNMTENVLDLYAKKKMYKETMTSDILNVVDTLVEEEKQLCGGEYWIYPDDVSKVHEDDYVEFSVVDKDNILGMFILVCANCGTIRDISQVSDPCINCASQDRFQVGTHILELTKYIKTDYVKKGNPANGFYTDLSKGIIGTSTLYKGLYMRTMYKSHGAEDIRFQWRVYYYD